MRYIILQDSHQVNMIEATEAFVQEYTTKNGYEYAPIMEPEAGSTDPVPDPGADRDAMLVDLEYRMTLLELGVN